MPPTLFPNLAVVPGPAGPKGSAAQSGRFNLSATSVSVLGPDLKITGQGLRVVVSGRLDIEGEIEGDVIATELIVGPSGLIVGTVVAEHVIVSGRVQGTIRAKEIVLRATSIVEGDLHSAQLTMDAGCHFEGRASRQLDVPALDAELAASRR